MITVGYDVILFVVISVPTEMLLYYVGTSGQFQSLTVVLFMVHVPNCAMHVYNSTSISMKQLRVSLHDIGSEILHE